jgi:sigma-54 dependent transcriptional regulator, acetoin dehydrogenase operon transcriptional activator AcoR
VKRDTLSTRSEQPQAGFPDPGRERQVMAAWERFLQNREVAPNTLRAPIESSWSRCLSAGVDPARVQAPTVLPAEELMTLRALHRELIEASVPIMAQARDFLSASGTILMLTDPHGIVLQTEGDPSALEAALDIRLMAGANWTELNCGTNAIGTALSTREPVQVHAGEHFCIGIKPWTCSATVVHDPISGEILGALDVSGLQGTFNHHCLALVLTAADRIEERLMNREMELGERLLVAGLGRLSRLATGGLLFFDRKGRFIKADARADMSLAAMAIKLESTANIRIDAFSADSSATVGQPGLPKWLLPEWVEPIIEGGRRIGTIVVLPDPTPGKSRRPVQAAERVGNEDIVGASPALHAVLSQVSKVAPTNSTVLIAGETGTGKELIARAIHKRSQRAARAFVSLNCAAIPQSLITSELFGHEKGAFTGALQRRLGRFELAEGGTIFLDEVGDLPMETQIALLRVLQEREFERVGGTEMLKCDVRVIAATNRDLQSAIAAGSFRSDLFYRLNVFPIELPPLRERKEDIPILVNYFVNRYAQRAGKKIDTIRKSSIEALQEYSWPGNVRELQNVIERSLIIVDTNEFSIDKNWFAHEFQSSPHVALASRISTEQEQIEAALAQTKGKVSGRQGAAAILGMPASTLESKIRSLRINKFQFKEG